MLSKPHKALGAVGLLVTLLAVSACGASGTEVSSATPSAAAAETSTTSAPKLDTSNGVPLASGHKPGDVINGIPTKQELANDGKGVYIQTTIAADDPALQHNPDILTPDVLSTFTEDEVKDFQKFVVTFIAEETIDSTLNDNSGDVATQDAWWAKHQNKFHPSAHAAMLDSLRTNTSDKALVFRAQFRGDKYSLVNGDDVTRVYSRTITPTTIKSGTSSNGLPIIGLQANVEFAMNASFKGRTVVEASNGQVSYTATKGESGKWQFSGYYSTFNTVPVA